MFANLVANGARSFASGLAGSGAFATAASAESFVQHSFVNSFNMFTHCKLPPNKNITVLILTAFIRLCKEILLHQKISDDIQIYTSSLQKAP